MGIYEALRDGVATSATLMVPCPWAREAASRYRGEDVGVHLTLNAEHELYRWGPITQAPSLLDGDGGFPRTVNDVWDHADLDEVRRELRAQVERAILWGFDVSHLDSHMGTLQLRPEFFDVYLDLAVEFGLPLRLSGASTERAVGFPFRRLAAEEGVVFPDHFVHGARRRRHPALDRAGRARPAAGGHRGLRPPGRRHPRAAGPRPDWPARVDDHELVTRDGGLRHARAGGVHRIGFRPLRDLPARRLMRGGRGIGAAGLLLATLAGCGGAQPSPPTADRTCEEIDLSVDHTIVVDDEGFDPAALEMTAGEVVRIVNEGESGALLHRRRPAVRHGTHAAGRRRRPSCSRSPARSP